MPRVTLLSCRSPLNPVLEVEYKGGRLAYGVPEKLEEYSMVVVHSSSIDVVEALRRLEPAETPFYVPAASTAARLASALGFKTVEVYSETGLDSLRLLRGQCGLYLVVDGGILLTPPCRVELFYHEALRIASSGARLVVVSSYGEAADYYLHRFTLMTGARTFLVECAAPGLGAAVSIPDIEVLAVGGSVGG